MTQWIGGIGDFRVLCVTTKKIYSCPESAAYHQNLIEPPKYGYSITEKDIIANCNNVVKAIVSGKSFQWYNQYLLDNKCADFYTPPSILPVTRPESLRRELIDRHISIREYYRTVRILYRRIKKTYIANPAIIGMTFTVERFLEILGMQVSRNKLVSLIKHFQAQKDIYLKLFDMEITTFPSTKSSREVYALRLNKFTNIGVSEDIDRDPEIKEYFMRHHDEESTYMKGDRSDSKPVMRISDSRIFGSISHASRLTGIDFNRIKWCCDGDIPYVPKWAHIVEFKYVKFLEKEPEIPDYEIEEGDEL